MKNLHRSFRRAIITASLVTAVAIATSATASIAAPKAPAPIAGQGYHLAFDDEFDKLDIGETGHKWCPGLWWEPRPLPEIGTEVTCSNSQLHLNCLRSKNFHMVTLATNWRDSKGGAFFRYGYFEARIKMPIAGNGAFWTFSRNPSLQVPIAPDKPATLTSEIDFIETDGQQPLKVVNTLHRNTSGLGGMKDEINQNNINDAPEDITKDFHTYGCLVTPKLITWYFDAKPIASCRAFDSTDQDRMLIFDLFKDGVLGSKVPDGVEKFTMDIDWIRVWTR
ncbi:MAG: glycoside hydrolase family 16 protein [Capsulimonadaceae bacterium]|nr:glycoside hydrolase family 16 protein [Capsulimonadaceae bacterium]